MRNAAAMGRKLLWPLHGREGGREGWRGSTAWHCCGVSRGAAVGDWALRCLWGLQWGCQQPGAGGSCNPPKCYS